MRASAFHTYDHPDSLNHFQICSTTSSVEFDRVLQAYHYRISYCSEAKKNYQPITWKNSLGPIPFAESTSEPVRFSDCSDSRMAWIAGTTVIKG